MSARAMDDSPWCSPGACAVCDGARAAESRPCPSCSRPDQLGAAHEALRAMSRLEGRSRELAAKLDAGVSRVTAALGFAPGGADFDAMVGAIERLRAASAERGRLDDLRAMLSAASARRKQLEAELAAAREREASVESELRGLVSEIGERGDVP